MARLLSEPTGAKREVPGRWEWKRGLGWPGRSVGVCQAENGKQKSAIRKTPRFLSNGGMVQRGCDSNLLPS